MSETSKHEIPAAYRFRYGYCSERIWQPPGYFHTHRCKRRAYYLLNDRPYCRQHYKMAVRRAPVRAALKAAKEDR